MKPELIVICATVGLLLVMAVVWLHGFNLWTAALAALLAVCPFIVLWVVQRRRDQPGGYR